MESIGSSPSKLSTTTHFPASSGWSGVAPVSSTPIASARLECRGTNLKLYNPDNAPDAWELAVLHDFEARNAAGEAPGTLHHAELVAGDDQRTFRYMEAIGTQPVCAVCHGTSIVPEVTAGLDVLYLEDRARGFDVGELRGAFSIAQPVPWGWDSDPQSVEFEASAWQPSPVSNRQY